MATFGLLALKPGYARWRLSFTDEASRPLSVASDGDGRPGYTLMASSKPAYLGVVASDGSRNDLAILVGKRSRLQIVCFPKAAADITPLEHTQRMLLKAVPQGLVVPLTPARPDSMAQETAVVCEMQLVRMGARLTEWKFVHSGWMFGAGILLHPHDDAGRVHSLAHEVLATWTGDSEHSSG